MDKLRIINRALGETGNNQLSMLADPDFPDEWDKANQALERRIDDLASRHNWPFAEKRAPLTLATTDADRGQLQYGYPLPPDCLHLRGVLYNGLLQREGWRLEGSTIWSFYSSGVSALYTYEPTNAVWHPQAAEILTQFMEASLLRSMNEDFAEADRREIRAEGRLAEARPHIAQQNPAKDVYQSSIARARRTRKA